MRKGSPLSWAASSFHFLPTDSMYGKDSIKGILEDQAKDRFETIPQFQK